MGGANLQERNYYQSQSWPFITVDYLEFYNFGGGIAPHVPDGKGPPKIYSACYKAIRGI